MNLFEEHKAERRARILAAARELIAERRFEGLTMRELARASRVSVPTLYNLFGGKHALLLGELESTFAAVVVGMETARAGNVVARALAVCDAGNADLLAVPRYSRELILLFLTSTEAVALRRASAERFVALMADLLRDGQKAGDVASWVDPLVLAGRMFAHYQLAMIEWARGELDADAFRAATRFGMCAMLLGVARGRAQRQLAAELRKIQPALTKAGALAAPSARRPSTSPRKGARS
jgi:AcrR family transcriptional regulator